MGSLQDTFWTLFSLVSYIKCGTGGAFGPPDALKKKRQHLRASATDDSTYVPTQAVKPKNYSTKSAARSRDLPVEE